jgi:predicted O-methyltransferase YrrM
MHFDQVTKRYGKVPYIKEDQALFLRDFIAKKNLSSLLELGTFQGKSAAYYAAILEDIGRGKVTTLDRTDCLKHSPNINDILHDLGLTHRVEVLLHQRSFTMTLMEMLQRRPKPEFDFCYFDGAHTWDGTGFCFLLVDLMLKPGAWVIFDDLDWTVGGSIRSHPQRAKHFTSWTEEEKEMKQVRKVFDILTRELGYINISEPGYHWGVAQKPTR